MLSNRTLFSPVPLVLHVFLKLKNGKKKRKSLTSREEKTSGAVSWWCPFLELNKTKLFIKTKSQPNSFDHQLSGWEEYFPLWCTDRNCPQCPLTSSPIKSCIVFISEICYFRMTEIFSQLRWGAEICKYVFGSVTVTMFSWWLFFFPNLKLFITTLGEKKKVPVCKSTNIPKRTNWP